MSISIGLQLYTVRQDTAKDFEGTLEKVAEVGYKGVEFAGYGGLSASRMKSLLDRLGLKPCGSHVGIDDLKNKLDEVIEYNLEIGNQYIICPWASYESKEDFHEMARFLNGIGERCRAKGLYFGYHNHAQEFACFDGVYGLDILYQETDPELVKAEIDVYWVKYAGLDPLEVLKKYAGRIPLIHFKDMDAGEKREMTEVGNGIIDFKAIADFGKKNDAKWFIVEQDVCRRPALESIKISYDNLMKMNIL